MFGSEERTAWVLAFIGAVAVIMEGGSAGFAVLILLAGAGVGKLVRVHDVLVEIRDQNEEELWNRVEERETGSG